LQASQIGAGLQATGLGLGTGLAESTLEAQLGYSALANALRQQQFQGLFDLLKGEQAAAAAPQNNSDLMKALFEMTVGNNNPFPS
jgi:lambda repressor-like predicted transcriptional regulator